MKVVAVSQRVDTFPDRNETRDALDHRLAAFIAVCGHMPIPVPNGLDSSINDWLGIVQPGAVLLSGGNDVGLYTKRDATERALLDYSAARRLPLLGICRGMQMMGCWAGTALHSVQGHVRTRHVLAGQLTGEANSYHAYSLQNCPDGFEVLARSEDGEIEAIRHLALPWEGWMWHPEREETFAVQDMRRAKAIWDG